MKNQENSSYVSHDIILKKIVNEDIDFIKKTKNPHQDCLYASIVLNNLEFCEILLEKECKMDKYCFEFALSLHEPQLVQFCLNQKLAIPNNCVDKLLLYNRSIAWDKHHKYTNFLDFVMDFTLHKIPTYDLPPMHEKIKELEWYKNKYNIKYESNSKCYYLVRNNSSEKIIQNINECLDLLVENGYILQNKDIENITQQNIISFKFIPNEDHIHLYQNKKTYFFEKICEYSENRIGKDRTFNKKIINIIIKYIKPSPQCFFHLMDKEDTELITHILKKNIHYTDDTIDKCFIYSVDNGLYSYVVLFSSQKLKYLTNVDKRKYLNYAIQCDSVELLKINPFEYTDEMLIRCFSTAVNQNKIKCVEYIIRNYEIDFDKTFVQKAFVGAINNNQFETVDFIIGKYSKNIIDQDVIDNLLQKNDLLLCLHENKIINFE